MIEVLTQNRTCPPAIQQRIARAGGRHSNGLPWFRVVWGWSRLTWIGGKWEEWENGVFKYAAYEYRQVPKSDPFFRWQIEKLLPPEFFGSPSYWYESTLEVVDGRNFYELGPYPERGEYELCFPIQTPAGEFLELSPSIVDFVVHAVERSRYLVNRDKALSLEMLRRRQAQIEAEWEAFADAVLDDAALPFHGDAHSVVPELEFPTMSQTLKLTRERMTPA